MFPLRFKQTFAFQLFRLFRHSFQDSSNLVSLRFGLLVDKWSLIYPTLVRRIFHCKTARSKHLNEGMLILSNLELPGLLCVAPITAISRLPKISIILRAWNHLMALWEGDSPLWKVYEGPLGYAEGSPLTLYNHFIQPYRALDTVFSKYY